MRYSPEPWRLEDRKDSDYDKYVTILDANNVEVIEGGLSGEDCCACSGHPAMLQIDAERIVACVNACRGIPTEVLRFADAGEVLDNTATKHAKNVAVALLKAHGYEVREPYSQIVIHDPIVEGAILELDERLKRVEAAVFPPPPKYRKPIYLMTPQELQAECGYYGNPPESDK
jgi:hypothetical protein